MIRTVSAIGFSFLFVFSVFADEARFKGLHWGGPGFDKAGKHTQFSARLISNLKSSHFEIWVDSKKTYRNVQKMVLKGPNWKKTSNSCIKAGRHKKAPYTCIFDAFQIPGETKEIKILIYSTKGLVLRSKIKAGSLAALKY